MRVAVSDSDLTDPFRRHLRFNHFIAANILSFDWFFLVPYQETQLWQHHALRLSLFLEQNAVKLDPLECLLVVGKEHLFGRKLEKAPLPHLGGDRVQL